MGTLREASLLVSTPGAAGVTGEAGTADTSGRGAASTEIEPLGHGCPDNATKEVRGPLLCRAGPLTSRSGPTNDWRGESTGAAGLPGSCTASAGPPGSCTASAGPPWGTGPLGCRCTRCWARACGPGEVALADTRGTAEADDRGEPGVHTWACAAWPGDLALACPTWATQGRPGPGDQVVRLGIAPKPLGCLVTCGASKLRLFVCEEDLPTILHG